MLGHRSFQHTATLEIQHDDLLQVSVDRPYAADVDYARLRAVLQPAVVALHDHSNTPGLAGILASLGLPPAAPDAGSKRGIMRSGIDQAPDETLGFVARALLDKFPPEADVRNQVEDLLWADLPSATVNAKTRRTLATSLDVRELVYDRRSFDQLLIGTFVVPGELADPRWFPRGSGLRGEVERYVYDNPGDWRTEELFERIGAMDCPDRRFCVFLERLVSWRVRPDEAAQRALVATINVTLQAASVELRETAADQGYPVFTVVRLTASSLGRPKTLIFASTAKPGLRVSDVIDNEIEIFANADEVLVYDLPIHPSGLAWSELLQWWLAQPAETAASDATLRDRLRASLPPPDKSPPQRHLFEGYLRLVGDDRHHLPALLPEVWLHWDPKTVQERGVDALLRSRMDFLLLLPHGERVVIEVDGVQHYAARRQTPQEVGSAPARPSGDWSDGWKPDPKLYGQMVAADRQLRLRGYEVYRFGGWELYRPEIAAPLVTQFFLDLFRRHGVRT